MQREREREREREKERESFKEDLERERENRTELLQFGRVHANSVRDLFGCDIVAGDESEVTEFFREMKTLMSVGSHPNVVSLLGVCTQNGE